MGELDLTVDAEQATARLLRCIAVEGVTGQEKGIAQEVVRHLIEAGVPRTGIRFDTANERIPLPTDTGNLIVQLPGTRPGPRRLFMTHLDTVPLCSGVQPLLKGNRVIAAGETALGGDNRAGVACLITLANTLLSRGLPHPPLTLLFTVREESGLWGARTVNLEELGNPVEGYNVDGGAPAELTVGAVGAERWEVEVVGKAAHAGVHPEKGVSATIVASLALADAFKGGWFGKVRKTGKEGTSNVGVFGGRDGLSAGEATNVVTDYVVLRGESRSHNMRFVKAITAAYRNAFRRALTRVRDDRGRGAKLRFDAHIAYHPFRLREKAPVVRRAMSAAGAIGLQPVTRITNGGLDANWLVHHGLPTVTFGIGQRNIHTIEEYVDLPDFLAGCKLALALATQDD